MEKGFFYNNVVYIYIYFFFLKIAADEIGGNGSWSSRRYCNVLSKIIIGYDNCQYTGHHRD